MVSKSAEIVFLDKCGSVEPRVIRKINSRTGNYSAVQLSNSNKNKISFLFHVKHFSGIQDIVRIQRLFDRAHSFNCRISGY